MTSSLDSNPPIFIHAWFRSGSTYLWSKLRRDPQLISYYEPLHESIENLDPAKIQSDQSSAMAHDLRHPKIGNSYFYEYAELPGRNINFKSSLSYDEYYLSGDDPATELKSYMTALVTNDSNENARRPVLCFCRSQMRVAWMKNNFSAIHISQIRNPLDQWNSFQISHYFIDKVFRIAHSLDKRFNGLFDSVPNLSAMLKKVRQQTPSQILKYNNIGVTNMDVFIAFLIIWYMSSLQSIAASDRVVDIDVLSSDNKYAKLTERYFQSLNINLDLNDCKSPHAPIKKSEYLKIKKFAQDEIAKVNFPDELNIAALKSGLRHSRLNLSDTTRDMLLG